MVEKDCVSVTSGPCRGLSINVDGLFEENKDEAIEAPVSCKAGQRWQMLREDGGRRDPSPDVSHMPISPAFSSHQPVLTCSSLHVSNFPVYTTQIPSLTLSGPVRLWKYQTPDRQVSLSDMRVKVSSIDFFL